MQQISKYYDNLCEIIEKDTRINEFGLYGISFGLLSYALLRRRPLSKFTSARDIPDHFIREKVLLEGVVTRTGSSPKGPVLSVIHKSPVNISFSKKTLPVVVAGVQTDANGLSWLQFLTENKTIQFIPISNEGHECLAKVFITRENETTLEAGPTLIKLGFARAIPIPDQITSENKSLISYSNRLKQLEKSAKYHRQGQWHLLPENWLQKKLRKSTENLSRQIKLSKNLLPKLSFARST